MYQRLSVLLSGITLFLAACGGGSGQSGDAEKRYDNVVRIHNLSDPKMLNPFNTSDNASRSVRTNIFQTLLAVDFKTVELAPVLAESRPEITTTKDSGMIITYDIRPEAKWDNGEPITSEDVAFSLKVIKNPKVNCPHLRPYYEFVDSLVLYKDDPRKVTFVCGTKYLQAEAATGGFEILPPHIYDPEGLMESFTVAQLDRQGDQLTNNEKISKFAQSFNAEKYQREKGYIVGSGPYKFEHWHTGQEIVLKRKEDWWGDQLTSPPNVYFEAYPEKLIYKTINDHTTAIVSLKGEQLDVMHGIPPKDFKSLPESEKFKKNFEAYSPTSLVYYYLGINMKNPKLADKRVRKALAHLIDVDKIIKEVYYGLAERVIGPVHPSRGKAYNDTIQPYGYNPKKAKQLLHKAGWKDTNGNGTLDKKIEGQLTEFDIEFIYNSGNEQRKLIGLIFQEEARRIGINVNVIPQDWSVYLENLKQHKFEMCCNAWIASPVPSDPKQIWHTASYDGGSNYVGFGDPNTDALIEKIRHTLNEKKRAHLYRQLQVILHDRVPYIFLFAPKERIATHKRFTNAYPSVMRPGFWPAGFKLKKKYRNSAESEKTAKAGH